MATPETKVETKTELGSDKSKVSSSDLPQKPIEERAFDDRGHLKETEVPNKDALHVHSGQILDKGTPVLQTRQEVPIQENASFEIIRAARPTGADTPEAHLASAKISRLDIAKANIGEENQSDETEPPDEHRPENMARAQATQIAAQYSSSIEDNRVVPQTENPIRTAGFTRSGGGISPGVTVQDHPLSSGVDDRAIPGSRVGNPLTVFAENLLGDKVFDVRPDGSTYLMVQTKDKSRAFAFDGSDLPDQSNPDPNAPTRWVEINKMKVEFKFPSINPKVSQRHLLIMINNQAPMEMVFPPDVSHVQLLLPMNEGIHAELTHVDQEGYATAPYMIDFYTNHSATPRPLEASPLGVELMENVLVRVEEPNLSQSNKESIEDQASPEAQQVRDFPRKDTAKTPASTSKPTQESKPTTQPSQSSPAQAKAPAQPKPPEQPKAPAPVKAPEPPKAPEIKKAEEPKFKV